MTYRSLHNKNLTCFKTFKPFLYVAVKFRVFKGSSFIIVLKLFFVCLQLFYDYFLEIFEVKINSEKTPKLINDSM